VLFFHFIGYEPFELANISVEKDKLLLDPAVMNTLRLKYDLAAGEEE